MSKLIEYVLKNAECVSQAGDQSLALRLMGLGALLGLWKLLTPRTMLGADIPDALAQQMAGMGLLTVQAVEAKAW